MWTPSVFPPDLDPPVAAAEAGSPVEFDGNESRLATDCPTAVVPGLAAWVGNATREIEVLQLVADGATNREAARALSIGEATIETHLLHAFTKLGVDDRTRQRTP